MDAIDSPLKDEGESGLDSDSSLALTPVTKGIFGESNSFRHQGDAISGLEDSDFDPEYLDDPTSFSSSSTESSSDEASSSDQGPSRRVPARKRPIRKIRKPRTRIIVNVSCTQYEIVEECVRALGFKVSRALVPDLEAESSSTARKMPEWDLLWQDCAVNPGRLQRMAPNQRINHFPGMYELHRKKNLARNLMKM